MSKVLSRFNWPVIMATVMVVRFLLQQTSTNGSVPATGEGVGGILGLPAAIHETIQSGLHLVAPAPWDHVVLGVSGLLVIAAWARWLLRARP